MGQIQPNIAQNILGWRDSRFSNKDYSILKKIVFFLNNVMV